MEQTVVASVHQFDKQNIPFSPKDYSYLKFGSDRVAQKFGYELADNYFYRHASRIIGRDSVVVPSPYNHIPNAATIMTYHFLDKLNDLLVQADGRHIDMALIKRKISYTADYGFLPKEQRQQLISNDEFYLPMDFLRGKHLIFIDDIKITGTHEDKLRELMVSSGLQPYSFDFLYYAQFNYQGQHAEIESELNFAGVKTMQDYLNLMQEDNHRLIVRPIKFLLSRPLSEFHSFLHQLSARAVCDLYHACNAEGYYRIPQYQHNLALLRSFLLLEADRQAIFG